MIARRFLALAALAVGLATPAHAQSPFRLGLSIGPSFPTGDLSDTHEWGYHITGSISGRPMLSPIGLRGEVMYNSVTGKDITIGPITEENDDASLIAGLVNVEAGLGGVGLRPYLIGGVGYYSFDSGGEDSDRVGRFGINGGAGLSFGLAGFSAFAEARYHSIFTDEDEDGGANFRFIPISVGFKF